MTVPTAVEIAITTFTEDQAYGSVEICFQAGEITVVKTNRTVKVSNSNQREQPNASQHSR